jgi:hypothetical protein
MKQKYKRRQLKGKEIVLIVVLSIISSLVMAQEIKWSSIDGGGGISNNGNIKLIGVIGQADTTRMSAGGLSVAGGYLPLPANSNQDPIFKNGFE